MPSDTERPAPAFGVDESLNDVLDVLVTDSDDLSEGNLSDIRCTILGFAQAAGGEERQFRSREDPTQMETRITPDRLRISLRIDNLDEVVYEYETVDQFLTLPKAIQRNGTTVRGRPNKNSTYAAWIFAWENLGVSSNAERAQEVQLSPRGLSDFVGLQFRRETRQVVLSDTISFNVDVPTELYGYDNDVRTERGLEPKQTASQRRAAQQEGASAMPTGRARAAATA